MPKASTGPRPYDFIVEKIHAMKNAYSSLRNKPDSYVFSALCVKSNFYKNPSLILNESEFNDIVVDSPYDGGADILLSDPSSDGDDLVIGQSKFQKDISADEISHALEKMASFLNNMINGQYDKINVAVQRRFMTLYSDIGDESKIHFVLYSSAPKSRIRSDIIEKKFSEKHPEISNFEVSILFANDIVDEIKESESRRPSVEYGKICIDKRDNYLLYEDSAAMVNVSAYSIKQLYAQHNINLLARNLRYYISDKKIDNAIKSTIDEEPESFWLKNNGITIICDDFIIDGKEVKLQNFSIVNGGQTTYQLNKSDSINKTNDLYLPCKIIKIVGDTENEKNNFALSIAKATNSQKPIKPADLKANSSEQLLFAQAMREVGVFYQTKRGEDIPRAYKCTYLNANLKKIGKLCLCGIFQAPGLSRNRPSCVYDAKYYNPIFNANPSQIAKLCKELLYIDNYFRTVFQRNFDKENNSKPNSSTRISFAHNARTICIAFVALTARYRLNNITSQDIAPILTASPSESNFDILYEVFRNLGQIKYFLPPPLFENKDKYDNTLSKLFSVIIEAGILNYSVECRRDTTLTATNYLKKDKSYYDILGTQWDRIIGEVNPIFDEIGM